MNVREYTLLALLTGLLTLTPLSPEADPKRLRRCSDPPDAKIRRRLEPQKGI